MIYTPQDVPYQYTEQDSILKRKDPKKMTMSELDEYINKNKARMKSESESPTFESNNVQQNLSFFPKTQNQFNDDNLFSQSCPNVSFGVSSNVALENKIRSLEIENDELKRNFSQLSQMLENERNEYQNKLSKILEENEKKFLEDNKNLLKQIDELKLQNSLNQTNMSILTSEKERHIEQNAIDKEYYETQIRALKAENEELKKEIKEKVKSFSSTINEQQVTIENDFRAQIKAYKDIINNCEKDKNLLIKKYEKRIHELNVKINRLERGEAKSKSRSKGKYTSNNLSILNASTKKSKSRSKSKGKLSSRPGGSQSKGYLFTLKPKESESLQTSSSYYNGGSSLININDSIFNLERNIADLNYNYKQTLDKLKFTSSQDQINALNRNLSVIKGNITDQTNELNNLKTKQQDFLKKGILQNEI